MPSEACMEELETLSAIFLDEIDIKVDELVEGKSKVSMVLYPATADDKESRYVTMTLELGLCPSYPKAPPSISLRNPRGLNDAMLGDLMTSMVRRCEELTGSQMIYELIDMAKEFLTKNNRPASECPICLLAFTEADVFHRTNCFHHFHSHCLGSYLNSLINSSVTYDDRDPWEVLRRELETLSGIPGALPKPPLLCPVCREKLEDGIDVEKLMDAPPPSEAEGEGGVAPDGGLVDDWKEKKEMMKQLYEKQKAKGGIIDLNENRKLLVISTQQENGNNGVTTPPDDVAMGEASIQTPLIPPLISIPVSIPPLMERQDSTSRRANNGGQRHGTGPATAPHEEEEEVERCYYRRGGGYNNRRRYK